MRLNRSIRNRGRREKKGPFEIDITSLLDILVILLVFLLKSYNASGVVLNVPKDISLPRSNSQNVNTVGVNIQVSPTKVWVDDKVIVDSEQDSGKIYDYGGKRIIPLFNELVKKKETFKQVEEQAGGKKFSGIINLIVDKSIKYNYIKKLLFTSAEAGYQKYKFVVLGD